MEMVKSHSSSAMARTPLSFEEPAQFKRMSTFLKCFSTSLAAALIESLEVTSHWTGRTSTLYFVLRSLAKASRRSKRRARIARSAPWRAKASAICLPRPELAPETTATCFSRLNIKSSKISYEFYLGEQYALPIEHNYITLKGLFLVVDWLFVDPDYDPEPMILPKEKYPVINDWKSEETE